MHPCGDVDVNDEYVGPYRRGNVTVGDGIQVHSASVPATSSEFELWSRALWNQQCTLQSNCRNVERHNSCEYTLAQTLSETRRIKSYRRSAVPPKTSRLHIAIQNHNPASHFRLTGTHIRKDVIKSLLWRMRRERGGLCIARPAYPNRIIGHPGKLHAAPIPWRPSRRLQSLMMRGPSDLSPCGKRPFLIVRTGAKRASAPYCGGSGCARAIEGRQLRRRACIDILLLDSRWRSK